MSKFFGKSWWGKQWLNSLSAIDYSNRLPRGSAYARNGSVRSISINGNKVQAKVQGSRPRPYEITLVVPPFSAEKTQLLVRHIAEMPSIVSKLLNKELSPEILSIADSIGIRVFPNSWKDIEMECSCPDWAVPCKHLAAVIYQISTEIDNNPFLVFDLHGVDLQKELEKKRIFIAEVQSEIPAFSDLFVTEIKSKKSKPEAADKPASVVELAVSLRETLRSVPLSPIHTYLFLLLNDNPAFYQGNKNFKEKYSALVQKVVRESERILKERLPIGEIFFYKPKYERELNNAILSPHSQVQVSVDESNEMTILADGKAVSSLGKLLSELWNISAERLMDYQPSVIAMRHCLFLTINLLGNGAVVPKLVRIGKEQFTIIWQPALLSKDVKVLVEKTQAILPKNLFLWKDKPVVQHETMHIVSTLANQFIYRLLSYQENDEFLSMFFSANFGAFLMYGKQAIVSGIDAWLHRFFITQKKHQPCVIVDEVEEEFLVRINIQHHNGRLLESTPLEKILSLKKYEKERFEILQSLGLVGAFLPELEWYINQQGQKPLMMSRNTFAPFLMNVIPALRLLDMEILLPKSLQEVLKPRPSIRVKQKAKDSVGGIRLEHLLDFDWQVAIGDTLLDEKEFRRLFNKSEGLIKFKERYVYMSPNEVEKLNKYFSDSKHLSSFDLLRAALSHEFFGAPVALTDEVVALIEQLTKNDEIPLPDGLNAQLRPYQIRGYSWLYRNTQIGFGSIIADDMGLGKTIQVIATILKYKQEGLLNDRKVLVVAPTGLLTNWRAEIEKFAPDLPCVIYHGATRTFPEKSEFDVLLTSYGVLRSDIAKLKKEKWAAIVADEAQNIKNQETAQSKALKSIPASTMIAMSGTPVENRLSELWSIMEFCNHGFLGSLKEFREKFALPIQNANDIATATTLKKVTAPFLMRRMKTDKMIISDLPDKIEMDCFGSLMPSQASLYQKVLQKAMNEIEGIKGDDSNSLFVRNGLVLQMILALKQICNHPTQFLKNNVFDASLSGKTELLFDRLSAIFAANEKVLIFTQFAEMGKLLSRFIAEQFGEEPLFYHGGVSVKQRSEMVNRFQNDVSAKVFLLSLKAGGTGLNLTAANHVIHYDLWWNPAVEAQATDRAFRIGQSRNVMVHRFITKGTFEEVINRMIQQKKALAEMSVSTGENWIGNLSNRELKDIFELR